MNTVCGVIKPELYLMLKHGRLSELLQCPGEHIEPFMPLLARAAVSSEDSQYYAVDRSSIVAGLNKFENAKVITTKKLVSYLELDFVQLEADLRKQQQIRQKQYSIDVETLDTETGIIQFLQNDNVSEKYRYLLGILLGNELSGIKVHQSKKCEPLDDPELLPDACFLLAISCFEMPNLFDVCILCDKLMQYRNGVYAVPRLAVNFPDRFSDICLRLVENNVRSPTSDFDELCNIRRCDTVELLCKIDPSDGIEIMHFCVESLKMPLLYLKLSLNLLSSTEFVSAVYAILFGRCASTRKWLNEALQDFTSKEVGNSSALLLATRIHDAFLLLLSSGMLNEIQCSQASELLYVCCALKSNLSFKFSEEDTALILKLVCCKVEPSAIAAEFTRVALATLFAFPNLTSDADSENCVQLWLKSLLENEAQFEKFRTVSSTSYAEMLLLIAIHLHSGQVSALSLLVSAELKIKVSVRLNSFNRLKQFYVQDLFPEEVVAERAVKIPVTPSLTSDCSGFLPVHCVHQLLKNKIFSKHKVVIKNWILEQLQCCLSPIHMEVPALLDTFAACCVLPSAPANQRAAQSSAPSHTAFVEDNFVEAFSGDVFDKSTIVYRILLLYFALVYEENVSLKYGPAGMFAGHSWFYSRHFWNVVPVRFLTDWVQNNIADFAHIASSLMRLATTKFPYLYVTLSGSRKQQTQTHTKFLLKKRHVEFSKEQFIQAVRECTTSVDEKNPLRALTYLRQLAAEPLEVKVSFIENIAACVPLLLSEDVSRLVLLKFAEVWSDIESVHPRRLYSETLVALMPQSARFFASSETYDPLEVLKCDERIFRCGPILELFLRILSYYMMASRVQLQQTATEQVAGVSEPEREELSRALVGAEESAVIQILLDACLPLSRAENSLEDQLNTMTECRCIIFSYIHQCFISDPLLSKLVHFQGYSEELLPHVVAGVPSMHICLDFIAEMLSQPSYAKQVFGINLLSFLCQQYPIPKAYSCAKLVLDFLNTLLIALPSEVLADFFGSILGALVRTGTVFPPLNRDICTLLFHLAKILGTMGENNAALVSEIERSISVHLSAQLIEQ